MSAAKRKAKATTTFADYLHGAGALQEDTFVGLLVMYSFRGARQACVRREDVDKTFAARDLDPNFIPPDPTAAQAFLNSTGEKARGLTYKLGSQPYFAEMKPVGSDRETITRAVMSYEVRDKKHLHAREVGTLTFYKQARGKPGSERVRFSLHDDRLQPGERAQLEPWLNGINADYEWYKTYLYDQPIRQMVMRYIEDRLNGIKVLTSGGCYFVHRTRWDELSRLADAVATMSSNHFNVKLCPLVDLPEMRDMVIEAFQDEIVDDVTKLVEKIEKFRQDGRKVTAEVISEFSGDVRGIASRAEEHTRILDVSQDRTAGALEGAYAVLAGLASQIES